MIISKASKYGIRAMLRLATVEEHKNMAIRNVAEDLDISPTFLTKIFQMLSQAGLITSVRGTKGGVALSRSADDITLMHIVEAIEGSSLFTECLLGLPDCGQTQPCPVHDKWEVVREYFSGLFEETTLGEMVEDIRSKRFRLKDIVA